MNGAVVPVTWFSLLLPPQELVATTLHTLSLRLAASGNAQEALFNAEEAAELGRRLVLLAGRHKPFLARCLRNFSSQLRNAGHEEKSAIVLTEALCV
jgi:hypothetical protein